MIVNPKDIQIIINNRDRMTPLRELVTWLLEAGYHDLTVLDNDSAYSPLADYYDSLGGAVNVIYIGKNLMSKALWCWPPASRYVRSPFIYTDSDVVPAQECPKDAIDFLLRTSNYLGSPYKVGLGLRIDDIPDSYSQAKRVRKWENQNWERVIGCFEGVPLFSAGVDTTFALYSAFAPFSLRGVRVGRPYVAKHIPWYADSSNPSDEERYYESRAASGCHNWATNSCLSNAVINYCEETE